MQIQDEVVGELGLFKSKTGAMTRGRDWLYEQLSRLNDHPRLPLLHRKEGEFERRPLPGTWRRTGWNDDTYAIIDEGRWHGDYADVSLSVTIEEQEVDDGEGYLTDPEVDEDRVFVRGGEADGVVGIQAPAA